MEKAPKIELPQKPPQEPEIKTWENEGGGFETEEAPVEVPETVIEEPKVTKSWQELVIQAKEEFPEEIKIIIDKAARKENLTPKEVGALDGFSYRWFRETFGIKLKKKLPKKLSEEELEVIKQSNKEKKERLEKKRTKKTRISFQTGQ